MGDEPWVAGMRDEQSLESSGETREREPSRRDAVAMGATYGVLAILGFLVGVYGVFYYSLSLGVVPVGALVAVVVNFVMCRAASRSMRTRLAAMLPAAGWLIAVVLLSAERTEGDVLITNSTAGYILLVGGIIAAAVPVAMSLVSGARTDGPGGPGSHSDVGTRG